MTDEEKEQKKHIASKADAAAWLAESVADPQLHSFSAGIM